MVRWSSPSQIDFTVNRIADFKEEDLHALERHVHHEYEAVRARGLALDMTRGKPSPEQLDLATDLLALPGKRDHFTEAGDDARNYGGVQGLAGGACPVLKDAGCADRPHRRER